MAAWLVVGIQSGQHQVHDRVEGGGVQWRAGANLIEFVDRIAFRAAETATSERGGGDGEIDGVRHGVQLLSSYGTS